MGILVDKIIETENLHWAWKKVKNCFQVGDIWYDEIELASFESNLHEQLELIKKEIKSKTFFLHSIKPLPFPKGYDMENKKPRVRQTFEISVRDQVIWMAITNVIGNSLDYKMPSWSYGHRLFVPVWKGSSNNQWEIGWYRHSRGLLYRKWNQSWPLFRRSISLTAKIMCCKKNVSGNSIFQDTELEEAEKRVYENNKVLPNHFKSKYLEQEYWGDKSAQVLYWATVDFSKFYPKVKRELIKNNILKHTTGANEDEEFRELIERLFDFKIDASQWVPDELGDNGISLDPQTFPGLPTGLFVAGFLANVALLEIDEKISEQLYANRNIAHFRFVDDHVILSYDFDKLKEWIQNYRQYLVNADSGAEFNFEKIEPKSLSNLLNPEWEKHDDEECMKNEEEKAKEDTKLDPAFPAPLMTQTLAKVSAISKSDFEFLSHNEEEQLISDLEHLLLTDFPDHELRKDTRVSFAASILSRIVPDTKIDYADVYECQKKIHHLIEKYKKKFEKSNTSFVSEKLHDIIFEENINLNDYFDNWISQVGDDETKKEFIESIKEQKNKEWNLLQEIDIQKKSQKNRVYKLLKKAILENPEKVRIWTRVIDYCRKVDCCHIREAYDKIKELENQNKIHILSSAFLRTLFLSVLSDRIMTTIYYIANKKCLSKKESDAHKFFFQSIFDETFLSDVFVAENVDKKPYYKKTFEFYKFVLGTTLFMLEKLKPQFMYKDNIIQQYKLIDWNNNPQEWIKRTDTSDINSWLYWILWKTHDKSSSKPLNFWLNLQQYIDYSKASYKPLILPFPNYSCLPKTDDEFLMSLINEFEEGWLFEVFKTGKDNLSEPVKNELKNRCPNLYKNIFKIEKDKITLWDYIQWQKEYLNNDDSFQHFFDPRLSEWTALEIIKQIIQELKSGNTAVNFFEKKLQKTNIHPSNFSISNEVKRDSIPSWNEWKETKINLTKVDSMLQIVDDRYTTKGLQSELTYSEDAEIHALGIILLQLLTHNTDFPWIWNSDDKSLVWENLVYNKIQESNTSSFTLLILQSCFSSKNRETFRYAEDFNLFSKENNGAEDTIKDPPMINDLNTLERFVVKAQNIIERYQLSMENNVPRQLIPISLEQLSRQNNPFDNSNNDS